MYINLNLRRRLEWVAELSVVGFPATAMLWQVSEWMQTQRFCLQGRWNGFAGNMGLISEAVTDWHLWQAKKEKRRFLLYISMITYGINNKVIYSLSFSLKIDCHCCHFCHKLFVISIFDHPSGGGRLRFCYLRVCKMNTLSWRVLFFCVILQCNQKTTNDN